MALLIAADGRLQRLADREREIGDGSSVPRARSADCCVRRARLTYRAITFCDPGGRACSACWSSSSFVGAAGRRDGRRACRGAADRRPWPALTTGAAAASCGRCCSSAAQPAAAPTSGDRRRRSRSRVTAHRRRRATASRALPDGTPCFIPRALPGRGRCEATPGAAPQGACAPILRGRARPPARERVAPALPAFRRRLRRLRACSTGRRAAQAAWKRDRAGRGAGARRLPRRAGRARPSPRRPGRRRRADLALRRAAAAAIRVGFHARGQRGGAGPRRPARCCDPRLVALLAPLRAMLRRLPALRREGSAVVNLLDTGPDLLLRTDGPLDAPDRALLAAFAARPRACRASPGRRGDGRAGDRGAARAGDASRCRASRWRRRPAPSCRRARRARRRSSPPCWPALPARAGRARADRGPPCRARHAVLPARRARARRGLRGRCGRRRRARGRGAGAPGCRVAATRRDLARQPLTAAELAALRRRGAGPALRRRAGAGGAAGAQRGAAGGLCLVQPGGAGARRAGLRAGRLAGRGRDADRPVRPFRAGRGGGRLRRGPARAPSA